MKTDIESLTNHVLDYDIRLLTISSIGPSLSFETIVSFVTLYLIVSTLVFFCFLLYIHLLRIYFPPCFFSLIRYLSPSWWYFVIISPDRAFIAFDTLMDHFENTIICLFLSFITDILFRFFKTAVLLPIDWTFFCFLNQFPFHLSVLCMSSYSHRVLFLFHL